MQITDRHFRYLARLLSAHARLYSEMVVADAIVHGDPERFLGHHRDEAPVALQLGGADPAKLAHAAKLGQAAGYCEINLNVGCPSSRVCAGRFGACLMTEPQLVSECIRAMREATDIPITVKTRTGVDRHDSYDDLSHFVDAIVLAGCEAVIVHARKAWLNGLSPRENRELPPLRYDTVHRLKRDFPAATIVINGGIKTLSAARAQLDAVDGVMIGRSAYQTPYMLADVDPLIFGRARANPSREAIFRQYYAYAAQEISNGAYTRHLAKPLQHLYQGQAGARRWRRHLGMRCTQRDAGADTLRDALACVSPHADAARGP